jgi:ribonucleotide reductase alpha subunit
LRPIGIGIQGLADCLIAMELPFGSDLAKRFDTTVYAALYFFAVHKSCSMARRTEPYRFWKESPWCTQTKLHCDGFPGIPGIPVLPGTSSTFIPELRRRVAQYGLRNSQLIAQMPTASTAHLTGNTESFEPLENILYVMREISGNFICINERVAALLSRNNLLTPDNVRIIKESGGSAQGIVGISAHLKQVLRTAYEIPQRELLEHAIARTPYVDQSMSLNVFFNHDASAKLPSYLFHAWRNGLKTATYYVRSKQKGGSIKFTLAPGGTEQPQCESCSA